MQRAQLTGPFATFLDAMDAIVAAAENEAATLDRAEASLQALIAQPHWLPPELRCPDPARYQQYALYIDPQARYSVVSFVWGPGQTTPVHDHTVWGLIGVLEGAEICEEYVRDGSHLRASSCHTLTPGEVDRVSPTLGDIHKVSNACSDRVTVSIHVYGGDIGRIARHVYEADGSVRAFVSGYSNACPWVTP